VIPYLQGTNAQATSFEAPIGEKDSVSIANQTITILLVEDAEEDVFFFTRALRKCDITTNLQVVRDGEAAWRFLKESTNREQLDVVFLDVKLPLMTGFEVLERLRHDEVFLPCPVLILSGSCEEVDRRRAVDLGVSEYLEKPITTSILRKFLPIPAIA
jgi:two-component system response regulator